MKWIRGFSLFLAVLLICGVHAPSIYAAEDDGHVSDSGTPIVLTSFDEPDRADATAFTVGTSREALADWFSNEIGGFIGYDAQGNAYDLITGTWSLEDVNTGTPGLYYAFASPDLSGGYVLGEGVTPPKQLCAVSIQAPGKPEINCCVSARGFLHFPWVLSDEQAEQLDEFTVWLRKDGGAWTQRSTDFCITSEDLQLPQRIFERGSTYELQVTYPGGQTGILTFLYGDEFSIVDYSSGDRDGGDVNGSDPSTGAQSAPTSSSASSTPNTESATVRTPGGKLGSSKPVAQNQGTAQGRSSSETAKHSQHDNEPTGQTASSETSSEPVPAVPTALPEEPNPAQEQAASAPETKPVTQNQGQDGNDTVKHPQNGGGAQTEADSIPQDAAPAVQESYSPTQTVISGLRLRNLCADETSVVFGEGGLTVSIPSKLLLALNLEDTDTLSVKLLQSQKDQVTFAVETSGRAVTEFPGTVLRLRYTPQSENTEITIWNKAGEKTTDAEFDGEFLRFSADAAGTYTISEAAAVSEKSKAAKGKTSSPPLLMGGGALLTGGGIAFIRRKFHG